MGVLGNMLDGMGAAESTLRSRYAEERYAGLGREIDRILGEIEDAIIDWSDREQRKQMWRKGGDIVCNFNEWVERGGPVVVGYAEAKKRLNRLANTVRSALESSMGNGA